MNKQTLNSTEHPGVYKKNGKHLNLRVTKSYSPISHPEDAEKYLVDTEDNEAYEAVIKGKESSVTIEHICRLK